MNVWKLAVGLTCCCMVMMGCGGSGGGSEAGNTEPVDSALSSTAEPTILTEDQ